MILKRPGGNPDDKADSHRQTCSTCLAPRTCAACRGVSPVLYDSCSPSNCMTHVLLGTPSLPISSTLRIYPSPSLQTQRQQPKSPCPDSLVLQICAPIFSTDPSSTWHRASCLHGLPLWRNRARAGCEEAQRGASVESGHPCPACTSGHSTLRSSWAGDGRDRGGRRVGEGQRRRKAEMSTTGNFLS